MLELLTPENLIALLTLASLEIVLGIDNIVFISILTAKLPEHQREGARRNGLLVAMGARIVLLLAISWVMRLTEPLFGLFGYEFSGKSLILLIGGLFLLGKATFEIHDKLEGHTAEGEKAQKPVSYGAIMVQILVLDLVFSLDSVITAVGMVDTVAIMIIAVVIAVIVMMIFAGPVANFIEKHPTMKILALSFLILIGAMLVAESFGQHVNKGYIYFAMGFSLAVEFLNMRFRKVLTPPVHLRGIGSEGMGTERVDAK